MEHQLSDVHVSQVNSRLSSCFDVSTRTDASVDAGDVSSNISVKSHSMLQLYFRSIGYAMPVLLCEFAEADRVSGLSDVRQLSSRIGRRRYMQDVCKQGVVKQEARLTL